MQDDIRSREFIGQGLTFPLQINQRGEIALAKGTTEIEQAIRVILETYPGERVMRPEFGCRAKELLFAPRNSETQGMMERYVRQALRRWEPRIEVTGVNVTAEPNPDGAFLVEINYLVKATHNERSIVYPFYLAAEEA